MTDKNNSNPIISPEQLDIDLQYSLANLADAMYRQDKFAAHYGVLAAKTQREVGIAKIRLQTTEAKVYKDIRERLAEEKMKATEAQVNAEVSVDKRIIDAKRQMNDANYYAELGRVCVEAFRQRRDMLTQISKHDLIDRQGEMSMSMISLKDGALQAASEGKKKAA